MMNDFVKSINIDKIENRYYDILSNSIYSGGIDIIKYLLDKNKIEYEVLPLIAEYINDGILNVSSEEKDSTFSAWLNLQTMPTNEEGLTYTEDNG